MVLVKLGNVPTGPHVDAVSSLLRVKRAGRARTESAGPRSVPPPLRRPAWKHKVLDHSVVLDLNRFKGSHNPLAHQYQLL